MTPVPQSRASEAAAAAVGILRMIANGQTALDPDEEFADGLRAIANRLELAFTASSSSEGSPGDGD